MVNTTLAMQIAFLVSTRIFDFSDAIAVLGSTRYKRVLIYVTQA